LPKVRFNIPYFPSDKKIVIAVTILHPGAFCNRFEFHIFSLTPHPAHVILAGVGYQ